jgi:hypothetical protein
MATSQFVAYTTDEALAFLLNVHLTTYQYKLIQSEARHQSYDIYLAYYLI